MKQATTQTIGVDVSDRKSTKVTKGKRSLRRVRQAQHGAPTPHPIRVGSSVVISTPSARTPTVRPGAFAPLR